MREWFAGREPRERIALVAGAGVVALALMYALVWYPLEKDLERNRALVEQQRETLAWMRQAAAEVASLRAAGVDATHVPVADQSLVSVVEQSARKAGLRKHIARMEPAGSDSVQLTVKDAPFDTLITWLAGLENAGQPQPSAFRATETGRPGLVNATLTLVRRGPGAQ